MPALTPLMLAAKGGNVAEAVKHALSRADLHERDATGRTALELAVEAEKRDTALALLLIATAKFTKPLPSLLSVLTLRRLQFWIGQAGARMEHAMGMLLQQYQGHLARGRALPANALSQVAAGVAEMLAWAETNRLSALVDRLQPVAAPASASPAASPRFPRSGAEEQEQEQVVSCQLVAGAAAGRGGAGAKPGKRGRSPTARPMCGSRSDEE